MSDATLDYDTREQLIRIDRAIAQTRKFQDESDKLRAEQAKLRSEGRKFDRDRFVAPALATVALIGGLAGLLGGVVTIVGLVARSAGHTP